MITTIDNLQSKINSELQQFCFVGGGIRSLAARAKPSTPLISAMRPAVPHAPMPINMPICLADTRARVVLCVFVVPCVVIRGALCDSAHQRTTACATPGSFPEASNAEASLWRLATVWVTTADL